MVCLGEIDAIILKELLKDGRKSFTAIAEENNVSKDIIWKHFNEMKKASIIVGATIQYNYPLFGYEGVASILVNVESQHCNEVFERLTKNPDIHPFRVYNSRHNIGVITTFKNLKDLDDIKEILKRQNPVIAIRTYLWTDVRNTPENTSFGFARNNDLSNTRRTKEEADKTGRVKLDEIDQQIVEELTKDGRAPFSKIAQSIGTSTDTVTKRYDRLVRNGFIKVVIRFNPLLLGYKALANFYIEFLSQAETKKAIDVLSKTPDVNYLVKISGDYDLHIAVLVKDIEDIIGINEEIMKISNVGKIEVDLKKLPPIWPGLRQYITTF